MINIKELRIGNKVNAFHDDNCVVKGTFIKNYNFNITGCLDAFVNMP